MRTSSVLFFVGVWISHVSDVRYSIVHKALAPLLRDTLGSKVHDILATSFERSKCTPSIEHPIHFDELRPRSQGKL